ncbi:DUF11 domain-containing protein [Streptomyces sp. NBC_00335]|uniref:DUF11 domain-containing protein n=1 Tax=unclassified Streptomyces TaxID=2593676 RepID=UPI002251AC38|nr:MULTISPECIES: DUF11 domain-containing protein [unclassified Streptomyces]MCX5404111.1 DUF11 domain-containing protein [Streptomyces sp. NBC_00086]
MRRVVRSRAGLPYRRRRTVAALSAVAACGFLSTAPSAASAPPDPGTTASESPGPSASALPAAPAAGTGQPSSGTEPRGDTGRVEEPGADSGAASQQLREGADLAVSGTLRPTETADRESAASAARETFDYVVTVTNRGPSTARQVRVTDRLPLALEFVSSRDGCTASGRTAVCGPLATLAVGASHAWVITVRLAPGYRGDGTDIVNEAVVDSATSDPDSRNNTSTLTGLEIPPSARTADLSLRKTAVLPRGREHVRPGEKFTYLITVRNEGPATARQLQVTDLLPSSLVLLSSPDDCAVAKSGERRVVCPPLDRLAAGETTEYRITVRAVTGDRAAQPPPDKCTPIENLARVTSASFDPDLSDNANRPGTTGPGGGRLCLVSDGHGEQHHGHGGHDGRGDGGDGRGDGGDGRGDGGDGHHGRDDHHDGREQHGGRGDLAHSGATVPAWLLWTSTALVAAGAALRTAFRVRRP